jgi:hypothetical protein
MNIQIYYNKKSHFVKGSLAHRKLRISSCELRKQNGAKGHEGQQDCSYSVKGIQI